MNLPDFLARGLGIGNVVDAVKLLIEEVQELKRDVKTLKAIYVAVAQILAERQAADALRERKAQEGT